MKRGNKLNAFLNKEWGSKVKAKIKKLTSSRRRVQSKAIKKKERNESDSRD